MLTNTTLAEIGSILENAESVLLFPHVNPDGDAVGACTALCMHLRKSGKDAWILAEGKFPHYISFLDCGLYTEDLSVIENPDVCMCVDCCEADRFPKRLEVFRAGRRSICVDHHQISGCSWDMYHIEPEASSASEIIYRLFSESGWETDKAEAEALYTGIVSDTGCFQYSNTTPETHRIAADLMETGVDINKVTISLFQSVDPRTARVRALALQNMELVAGGKGVVSTLSRAEREAVHAGMEHTEDIINTLRDLSGVEAAAFLKEDGDSVRVSMRAKTERNVASICKKYNGGGHIKAAGCTMHMPLAEAAALIRADMQELFED